ncbi:hypothetical protein J3D48_006321 [Pseudomonas fluorescens]|nr:hypothetical protein [Pseudomonas fluorescens]
MTIKLKLELASGQSLKGAPLELLSKGWPIARAIVDECGHVTFNVKPGTGELAVRVDRSILGAGWPQEDQRQKARGSLPEGPSMIGTQTFEIPGQTPVSAAQAFTPDSASPTGDRS